MSMFFFIRYNVTWKEVQKPTPIDGKVGGYIGTSVAISGNTNIIGARFDNERGINSGSHYFYTKISWKWTKNGKIGPEDGAYN